MKKIGLFLCTATLISLLASCGNKNEFTINGVINNGNDTKVYLVKGGDLVDSVVIADSTFQFKGIVEKPWIGAVVAIDKDRHTVGYANIVVEPAKSINLHLPEGKVSGTPMNESLAAFAASLEDQKLEEDMNAYATLYYSATDAGERAEIGKILDSLSNVMQQRQLDAAWNLYKDNRDNVLACFAMEMIASSNKYNCTQLDSILKDASEEVRNYEPVVNILKQLQNIDKTSVGKHYTDIQGVDGKLSDIIDGKLALVDFYASWCRPCRTEIKDNLVPLWKKYQKKGLVIVGLNVWERGDKTEREAAHRKVMEDLGITYPQLVDSTRTATDTYGVRGIPQIMLIGKDGTILARDLRGDDIEEIIKANL